MTEEVKAFTQEQLDAAIAEATAGLKSKVDELLGETKSAKQKARELQEAQDAAELERQKKAGEFKELYEKKELELEALRQEATQFKAKVQQKTIDESALAIASKLTRDTARANLLSEQVKKHTVLTENGVQFEIGGVAVEAEKLTEHLSTAFPFLVDGSGATGGGATGGNGGAINKTGKLDGSKNERAAYFAEKYNLNS